MKKIFTLICALVGLTATVNAATVDDIKVCKHSYVLVADDWNGNGSAKMTKGQLFGDDFFLSVTGNSNSTSKGKSNPAELLNETGEYRYGEAFAKKYGEYGEHNNSLRIKNAQDVFAMKVTAGSKLIFLMQGNNKKEAEARIPKIASDAKLENVLNSEDAPAAGKYTEGISAGYKYEWTAVDDQLIYIGSYNGDAFIAYVIVEANEAPGTPMLKASAQMFDETAKAFYKEVTCTTVPLLDEDSGETFPTVCTYTTDGSVPNETSPVYTGPIKCYSDQIVKFQAYMDFGTGEVFDDAICPNAENEVAVNLMFDAPTFEIVDNQVTIKSAYADLGADVKYFASYNDKVDAEGQTFSLESSATVSAYVKIINGSYGEYTSNVATTDVYLVKPITEYKKLYVTAGKIVKDEVNSTPEAEAFMIEGGAISASTEDFFVKDLEFAPVLDAQYRVPAEQEAYIKMNNTNITFNLGQASAIVVTCSKDACKNIASETVSDRQCKVNVDGTNYGSEDITVTYDMLGEDGLTVLETLPGNVIKFDLAAGIHTFKKFSGTGNIKISSIEIFPGVTGVAGVEAADEAEAATVVKAVKNGKLVIVKNGAEYNAAGAQVK